MLQQFTNKKSLDGLKALNPQLIPPLKSSQPVSVFTRLRLTVILIVFILVMIIITIICYNIYLEFCQKAAVYMQSQQIKYSPASSNDNNENDEKRGFALSIPVRSFTRESVLENVSRLTHKALGNITSQNADGKEVELSLNVPRLFKFREWKDRKRKIYTGSATEAANEGFYDNTVQAIGFEHTYLSPDTASSPPKSHDVPTTPSSTAFANSSDVDSGEYGLSASSPTSSKGLNRAPMANHDNDDRQRRFLHGHRRHKSHKLFKQFSRKDKSRQQMTLDRFDFSPDEVVHVPSYREESQTGDHNTLARNSVDSSNSRKSGSGSDDQDQISIYSTTPSSSSRRERTKQRFSRIIKRN